MAGGYIGQGLGYSRLSAPEDGLSQSLQFWGGQAGQRKAAADLAAERAKVRADEAKAAEEERKRKELKEKDWTAELKTSGYSSPDKMLFSLGDQYQTAYSNLIPQYKEALDNGDEKRRAEIDNQMKAIKRNLGGYQDTVTRLKGVYEGLKAKRDSGQMSPYYEDVWNTIQKFTTGDTQNAWVDIDPNTYEYRISYKEIGEDGTEVVKTVDPNMFINGTMNAVDKVDTETIARTLAEKAGKFKQEYYKNNRDITTEGFNLEFEKYLDKNIEESLSDKDVVAWAGEFRGERFGTLNGNSAKIAEYRKEMKEDIKKKIMGYEDVVDSKKLNLDEQELALKVRKQAFEEEQAKKPEDEEEDIFLNRIAYDAEQAMKGDYSGIVGVTISEEDPKTKVKTVKTVKGVLPSQNGKDVTVLFSDGTSTPVANTKAAFVNFMAQSDAISKSKYKDSVEKAITLTGTKYRDTTYEDVDFMAGFTNLTKDENAFKGMDDNEAATLIQQKLPEGYSVSKPDGFDSYFADEVVITTPSGEKIPVVYDDAESLGNAVKALQDDAKAVKEGRKQVKNTVNPMSGGRTR